ncbi:MAG: aminomethyl-transferring glycine dehydrogenase [Bacteroidota bacterium]
MINLNERVDFESRHIGPDSEEKKQMLAEIGVDSISSLVDQTIPKNIRLKDSLSLPLPLNEYEYLSAIRKKANKNIVAKSFIGQGYYNCIVPSVIQRNIFENPGWYTAYTPYQAEIAQGRLEALINFQTMVIELTGMEIANASLLDEGTAAAEAVTLLHNVRPREKKESNVLVVDKHTFPQTIDVIKTRMEPYGVQIRVDEIESLDLSDGNIFGIFIQNPNDEGQVKNYSSVISNAHDNGVTVAVAADLLSLCLIKPPGDWGADVVVGTSQRFGVPMGFGGPHAAFFATKEAYKRSVPGRIIGVSVDAEGNKAYRMALQTREQHIKRERATSNICTAQVLLAVMASMYAVYHGPEGLKRIASRVHGLAKTTADALKGMGLSVKDDYFDTLKVSADQADVIAEAQKSGVNFRAFRDGSLGVSFDETHTPADSQLVVDIFARALNLNPVKVKEEVTPGLSQEVSRTSPFLTPDVFHTYHSEHEMLRYLKRLENKDLSLTHSMISLGSCTMKLNATTEMVPISWPEFGNIHPFAPADQTQGYKELIDELGDWLSTITGFSGVSFQPNSGAQGEYAGLMVIRKYLDANGGKNRNVVLIPSSAHGTNPASAVMAGMDVKIVKCDDHGNIDLNDLNEKAEASKDDLAALMVTYPSTHGVFEEGIKEICEIIHSHGGQVYLDGANMNAQVGLTAPGVIGADVCHLNLHKTFCIPHGGGGPGVGPIGVAAHLVPFLPGNDLHISSAPFGSASILPISHAYIAMMGSKGLTEASQVAILNANYIAKRLSSHYPILYANENGRNAHELIIDCRIFKSAGIEVEDIAKRMMDYGYHAPTVSFPVSGTMMIEPTESETKTEIDRFCDVMISIRKEIDDVVGGTADQQNNVLKNAPHTLTRLLSESWEMPYSREQAAYPLSFLKTNKFWPSVSRIDSAYGDRNLICSCIPVEDYADQDLITKS